MNKLLIAMTAVFVMLCGQAFAGGTINVPYEEFKALYKAQIEKEVMDSINAAPFLYTIASAHYQLRLDAHGASCKAFITGRMVSGTPEPILLFSNAMIIRQVIRTTGGTLLHMAGKGICFIPSGRDPFSLELGLYIPASEDNRSGYIDMDIPEAVQNSLSASSPDSLNLSQMPGVRDESGVYHFQPRKSLQIRFSEQSESDRVAKDKAGPLSSRYKTLDTPQVVLDTVHCVSTFEENGSSLSTLSMNIPPEAGEVLKINAIPDTAIWNCRVNRKKVKVYTEAGKAPCWIIPLDQAKGSHVELSLLRKGVKMGIRGKLSLEIPAMELPTRRVKLTIGLPERVELISFDGPMIPGKGFNAKPRVDISGTPYYFTHTFSRGESIPMTLSYEEPVKLSKENK